MRTSCENAFLQSFFDYSKSLCLKNSKSLCLKNWNQRLGLKETKLNICHHMLTSSPQLQNRKNENVFKMSKDEKCMCKACKIIVFPRQICKFVGFLLPSSSWLLNLHITSLKLIFYLTMNVRQNSDSTGEMSPDQIRCLNRVYIV